MVHINFPRIDLNNNPDLQNWREKSSYKEGDWRDLREYLAQHPRFVNGIHRLPKCWYTELPQGDFRALDVEHFRPKNQAKPLAESQKKAIEELIGFEFFQEQSEVAYGWLEFDYRNYRLTTALPNRGGAKHIYFPLAKNSNRLKEGEFPWDTQEYCLLLDPVNVHDANLLMVRPDGTIWPNTVVQILTESVYDDLSRYWHTDGFNYIRAWITIYLYRLQEKILIEGRKEVYEQTIEHLDLLYESFIHNYPEKLRDSIIRSISNGALPSAQFALAARSAMRDYIRPSYIDPENVDTGAVQLLQNTIRGILERIDTLNSEEQSWTNP